MCIVSLVHASAYHFRSIEREHWEISYWCWSLKLSWMLRIIATAELGSYSGFTTTITTTTLTAARNVPALFLWAGIYFVIISPWSNISTRRGADTDTKLLLFGWDNFLSVFGESLSLAMERLHSQSSCCLFPHSCWRHLYQAAHLNILL